VAISAGINIEEEDEDDAAVAAELEAAEAEDDDDDTKVTEASSRSPKQASTSVCTDAVRSRNRDTNRSKNCKMCPQRRE
jgi:hypothetical protein